MADVPDATLDSRAVALIFQVTPETVSRWAETGKLAAFRTPGGRWRFRREDIEALLPSTPEPQDAA